MSDEAFKALGDPTRREILRLLGERDRNAGEIVGHFAVSQPAISRHPLSISVRASWRLASRRVRAQRARSARGRPRQREFSMSNILVINASGQETRVALIENGIISEYYLERKSQKGILGNIYKGRV